MILGALASAAMVASVFPFLSVLADPALIEKHEILQWAYEVGGFETSYSFLFSLGLGSIAVIVLSNLVLILQSWAVARYTQMRVYSISRSLFSYYLTQPYDFFLGRHTGNMGANILSETQQVVGQFLRPLAELIASVLTLSAVLLTIMIVDLYVATVLVGTVGVLYGGITLVARRYGDGLGRIRAENNEARYRISGEALQGIKDVKLLGHEAAYVDRFGVHSAALSRAAAGVVVISQVPRFAIQMLAFVGVVAACLFLIDPDRLQERSALGDLLPLIGVLAFAGQRVIPELQKVHHSITTMSAGAAALDRVHCDLVAGGLHLDRSQHPALGLRQALTLDNIRYTYPEGNRPSLSEVSFTIRAGERIGIVGESGAGKTTIADVILGLLMPQAGSIHADGIEVTQNNVRSWQRTVGYVPQDIFLTDASILENVAFGLPLKEIDADKVERSSRIAQIHDFITTELPDGYATQIGERGVRLSGGQRQRIAIARALYHDADLIVFDEATSALDTLTEREVMAAIEALPGDKTILMIAHRLSTVRSCNRVVLLKNGQVAATGDWDTLIRENAEFRCMAEQKDVA